MGLKVSFSGDFCISESFFCFFFCLWVSESRICHFFFSMVTVLDLNKIYNEFFKIRGILYLKEENFDLSVS